MDAPPTKVDLQAMGARDQEIILLMMQSLRGGEPKIDYARLGAAAGMTAKSATNWWCALRKKLQLSFGSAEGASAGKAPSAKRGRKPKKAAADNADADDMLTPPSTPPSGRKRKAAVLDKGEKDGEDSTDGQDGNDGNDKADDKADDKSADKDADKDGGSNDATMADASQDGQASAADVTTGDATTTDDQAGDDVAAAAVSATPAADSTSTTPAAPKKKRATTPRARGGGRGKNAKTVDNASSGVAKTDAAKVDAAKEDSDDD